ncbi:hypothetical protein KP803_10115 [Vibrio sp. ZSDE26]|uniref:Lipoprotein n=1 Tax=Vibrio amylolyticus TaxID=2847292 RepID=A0A9X1XIX6_9VIBR|nr:hypothetical protein [Vibrio amylolyticus]MCK6263626.1 hypothetical protein [Vibrio amylolyticus]
MNTKWIILIITSFLCACGGGGGGSDSSSGSGSGSVDSPSATIVATDDSNAPENATVAQRTMSDLNVPEGFSYNPVMGHQFDVDISSYTTERAYISIYGAYATNQDGSYTPNFNSRITSSTLDDGTASLDFCISDSQSMVLAEVWFYDGSDPIQVVIPASQNQWTL